MKIARKKSFLSALADFDKKRYNNRTRERRVLFLQSQQPANHAVRGFMAIGTLYSYLYCLLASGVMVSMPVLGGALYLVGQTAFWFGAIRRPGHEAAVSKRMRRVGTGLLAAQLLLLLALIAVCPVGLENGNLWRLAGIVLCVVLRPALTQYMLERALLARKRALRILVCVCGVQLFFLPALLLMLLASPLETGTVWALLGGYAVSGILESFPLDRMGSRLYAYTEEEKKEMDALRGVHAYRMHQNLMLAVAAALQVTQVMSFTYIAVNAGALILCMGIALLCTYAASALAEAVLRRGLKRDADPNVLMALGLAVWLYGLVLFMRAMDTPGSVIGYASLALCTAGATACVKTLVRMEDDMRRVAAFAIGHAPTDGMDLAQQARVNFASALGQLAALAGLVLISVFTAADFPGDWGEAFRSFSPLLTLPALLLVGAAALFALRFPLTRRHLDKLRRYMDLQQEGQDNASLHRQLEDVVVHKSLKRYGIKALLFVLRPFYRHKIVGRENFHPDRDAACVFVCNHGEIYGPVVTALYVPYFFRPWSTREVMEADAVTEHTMNGTFQDVKGVRRKILNVLMAKIGAPFLTWVLRSMECIPVYHDDPGKLRQTFRETIAALEAGDNILVFPENADTAPDHRYVREGVSEFFTGFAMIGQLYYNKTGKCAQFVPLYADKRRRTITFGVPTRYDPAAPASEEKERLCRYLRGEMLRAAGIEQEGQK